MSRPTATRPLYYDIAPGDAVQCIECLKHGITQQHRQGSGLIADPANSPDEPGTVHTICIGHVPDDAVIYNPGSKLCRNKAGDESWRGDV